jgi:hypothetical protein
MAADRKRQQNGTADLPLLFVAVKTDRKCDRTQHRADHDRRRDQHRVPDLDAGDFERQHAGIVHCRDAAGDDGAADPRAVAPVRNQRNVQADAGQENGGDQRQDGQADIIAARNSRRECQHRDEVGRPDAEAGRDRGDGKPQHPHTAGRFTRVPEQVDRGQGGQHANERGKADQPQIVLMSDAVVDFQHHQNPGLQARYRDARGLRG